MSRKGSIAIAFEVIILIMKTKSLATLLIFTLVLVITTRAQDAGKGSKTFEVKTNVLIVDETSNYAVGVKESDIKIFEGDIERKITSVEKIGVRRAILA